MNDEQITKIAERFCAMELPRDFNPDGGISFEKPQHSNHQWPTGTNLFTVDQTIEMLRHILGVL